MKTFKDEDKRKIREFLNIVRPVGKFARFLKGKSVVIVGPSQHMLIEKQKDLIDSFDIVVRFKLEKKLPIEKKKASYIGTKTDVMYTSRTLPKNEESGLFRKMKSGVVKSLENGGVSFYRASCPGEVLADEHQKTSQLTEDIMYTKVSQDPWAEVLRPYALGVKMAKSNSRLAPQAGYFGLMEILASEAAHVHIMGMTFYFGGGNMFYDIVKKGRNIPVKNKHDGIAELRTYIMAHELLIDKKKITTDDVLLSIIEDYCDDLPTKVICQRINILCGIKASKK